MELKELIKKLEKVEDPRRTDRGHILHKLVDILIIALCCLICNGTDFELKLRTTNLSQNV